jgi:hypothetical protein
MSVGDRRSSMLRTAFAGGVSGAKGRGGSGSRRSRAAPVVAIHA